ncbi:hypothetical protein KM043_013479 [Ampulex compressa]|nr:hypothetical protein KM043_013479 [Ampulex compressa]
MRHRATNRRLHLENATSLKKLLPRRSPGLVTNGGEKSSYRAIGKTLSLERRTITVARSLSAQDLYLPATRAFPPAVRKECLSPGEIDSERTTSAQRPQPRPSRRFPFTPRVSPPFLLLFSVGELDELSWRPAPRTVRDAHRRLKKIDLYHGSWGQDSPESRSVLVRKRSSM